jgi:hypothetical protein
MMPPPAINIMPCFIRIRKVPPSLRQPIQLLALYTASRLTTPSTSATIQTVRSPLRWLLKRWSMPFMSCYA